MKVLISSPFVDREAVGEPRWCYDLFQGISAKVDTILVAQTPVNRSYRLAEAFPHSQVFEFEAWKLAFLSRRLNALVKPNYLKFYGFARDVIRHQVAPASIACGHHFGPLGMRYPTPLQGTGIPYVMGPLGGSLPFPPGLSVTGRTDPWYYRLRDFDGLRFRFDPLLRGSYQEAAYLVGVAGYVEMLLASAGMKLKRFVTHSEIVAPLQTEHVEEIIATRASRPGPVRFLVVSRLIYSKGVQFALSALAEAQHRLPDWRLDVLGDGPHRQALQEQTTRLGLDGFVRFHGHVKRSDVDAFYRDADVFLFPSVREPSGAVIFEALSWGLPIIGARYGGPANHISDAYGYRIPVDDVATFEAGLADAMIALATSPQKRQTMGRSALDAARTQHAMPAMVDFFLDLYRQISQEAGGSQSLEPR
ncbi:glycosyltransferase family 4 protein [Novosphingobium sp.]|uniref:glycosyltransferase family 4 protein n=1 Tax=Novosphingobium sp. TaxID=1874826 RepID=UPI00261BC253|nr:glycosyltransferase [Novosphingobium sp.]